MIKGGYDHARKQLAAAGYTESLTVIAASAGLSVATLVARLWKHDVATALTTPKVPRKGRPASTGVTRLAQQAGLTRPGLYKRLRKMPLEQALALKRNTRVQPALGPGLSTAQINFREIMSLLLDIIDIATELERRHG